MNRRLCLAPSFPVPRDAANLELHAGLWSKTCDKPSVSPTRRNLNDLGEEEDARDALCAIMGPVSVRPG